MRIGRGAVAVAAAAAMLPAAASCQIGPAEPGAAVIRTGPPPWDAPRDAVAYIDQAGLERLPLDFRGPAPYTVTIRVTVDGARVDLPPDIGVDRIRAAQAAVHTHEADSVVAVEARTRAERPTLAQFFQLWGVRYDGRCLGDACRQVTVRVDGRPAKWAAELTPGSTIEVAARR